MSDSQIGGRPVADGQDPVYEIARELAGVLPFGARGDTVARWLPEYVHGKRMTVMQLMNHAAGVPHRLLTDDAQAEPIRARLAVP